MGSHVIGFLAIATLGAPLLFGLFWGAPLVAGELEAGTAQFAWTQSITRRNWLAVKAGWLLLASAVWGGAISALVTWWYGPGNALDLEQFDPGHFDLQDLVPVGYAVFATALGICAGAVLRRTLPAMAVTLGGFVAVRVLVTLLLRPHYMSPVTVSYTVTKGYTPRGSFWQIAQGVRDPSGHLVTMVNNEPALDGISISRLPASCAHAGNSLPAACQSALEHYRGFITYQPAGRYWTFQGIETGVFLVLAAVALAVTAVLLVRRDA